MSASTPLPVLQRTEAWLDARLKGIGSSEAAAAIGVSRWESKSRLWAIKLGLIPAREPTLPMLLGTATEDLNAQLYQDATGVAIRRERRMLRSKAFPWMQASLDRRAADRVVELKYSDRSDDYGEPGTDEVPDEVLAQVIHQMVVTGLKRADVSLIVGGRGHRLYGIDFDQVAAEETIERERELWRAVEERREPILSGPIEADSEYLAARYPRGNGQLIDADEDTRALLVRMRALQRNGKQVEVSLDEVKLHLRAAIGENDGVVAPGIGTLKWHRWPAVETTVEVTDWEAVAKAYRDLALEFTVVPREEAAEKLDAIAGIHTNTVTTVTKKAGSKLGPAAWDEEEEATDAVA